MTPDRSPVSEGINKNAFTDERNVDRRELTRDERETERSTASVCVLEY